MASSSSALPTTFASLPHPFATFAPPFPSLSCSFGLYFRSLGFFACSTCGYYDYLFFARLFLACFLLFCSFFWFAGFLFPFAYGPPFSLAFPSQSTSLPPLDPPVPSCLSSISPPTSLLLPPSVAPKVLWSSPCALFAAAASCFAGPRVSLGSHPLVPLILLMTMFSIMLTMIFALIRTILTPMFWTRLHFPSASKK